MTLVAGPGLHARDHGERAPESRSSTKPRPASTSRIAIRSGSVLATTSPTPRSSASFGMRASTRCARRRSPMAFYPLDATPTFVGSMHVRASGRSRRDRARRCCKALREIEPKLPVDRASTPIATLAAGTLRQERLIARLTTVLGALALGLACLGLYGLMSYAVKQRTGGARHPLRARRAAAARAVDGVPRVAAADDGRRRDRRAADPASRRG